MRLPEPLGLIADVVGDWIGGDPDTPRWEIITAVFGWLACGAFLGWLITSIVGFPNVAGYFVGVFWMLFGVAFKRDIAIWRHKRKRSNSSDKR